MIQRAAGLIVCVASLIGMPQSVGARQSESAKIAGHLVAHGDSGATGCAGLASLPPCNPGESHLHVQGDVGIAYDLYLMILDGDAEAGVAGAAFGITYDGAPRSGLDVRGWTLCADLEWNDDSSDAAWPDSGSGNLITWDATKGCRRVPAKGDSTGGVTSVLGVLYVYAYGDDVFEITRRAGRSRPEFGVLACNASVSDLAFPWNAGTVAFGARVGCDPCALDTLPPPPTPSLEENRVEPFTQTFESGEIDLWVGGHRITGPMVTCTWDGHVLSFNEIPALPIPPTREREPRDVIESMREFYMQIPSVAADVERGFQIHEATRRYFKSLRLLLRDAAALFASKGAMPAFDYLSRSPLVERVETGPGVSAGHLMVHWQASMPVEEVDLGEIDLHHPVGDDRPRPHTQAELAYTAHKVVELVSGSCRPPGGRIVFITRDGGLFSTGGIERAEIQKQIDFLLGGGDPAVLPRGRLEATRPPLSEIIEVLQSQK